MEVNSAWLITFELSNQNARKALITRLVYILISFSALESFSTH